MRDKTFSRLIDAVEPSQTLAITSRAKALKAEGRDVVNFAAGEPDCDTPENIKEAARRALACGLTKYTPAVGTLELRQAIAEKLYRDNGLTYEPSEIVASCGAKHALYNAVRVLCEAADEFIIFSPYWVTYPAQVTMAGGKVVFVETLPGEDYRIDARRLRRAVTPRTKAIVLNSPANPTGWVASEEELKAVAEVACERDLYLISDEIYEKIVYHPAVHRSIASLGEEVKRRTLVVGGVSKAYAMTGWRLGYLAATEGIARRAAKLQSHSTSNPASIAQAAAVEALRGDQRSVCEMVERFRRRRDRLVACMGELAGLKYTVPAGAFYTFPDISALGIASVEFARDLLEKKLVAVVPGSAFGAEGHVRISYAASIEDIEKGMEKMGEYMRERSSGCRMPAARGRANGRPNG